MDYYECHEPEFTHHDYWSSKTFITVHNAKYLYAFLRNIHQSSEAYTGKKIRIFKALQILCDEELDFAINKKQIIQHNHKINENQHNYQEVKIFVMTDFVTWVSKKISLPDDYHYLILPETDAPNPDPAVETQEKVPNLRNNQRHKERSRAIAEFIWSNDKDITIADMIICDAVIKYGCEGKVYSEKIMRNWINDLAPNRDPGRRPVRN